MSVIIIPVNPVMHCGLGNALPTTPPPGQILDRKLLERLERGERREGYDDIHSQGVMTGGGVGVGGLVVGGNVA